MASAVLIRLVRSAIRYVVDAFRICEMCWARDRAIVFFGVARTGSMTMYHWDGKGRNPNRDLLLCRLCAQEHKEFWTEMWQEYYSDRL